MGGRSEIEPPPAYCSKSLDIAMGFQRFPEDSWRFSPLQGLSINRYSRYIP